MGLAPLFVVDHATLRKKLRLTGVDASSDASEIIDEAILSTRMKFIARLTQARIATLLGATFTPTPSTDSEFLRALASVVETKMVRLELLNTLPVRMMDASGAALKDWNEEALFRETSPAEFEAKRTALENEIEQGMVLLAGEEIAGDAGESQVWDGSPVLPTPALGDSLCRTMSFLITGDL